MKLTLFSAILVLFSVSLSAQDAATPAETNQQKNPETIPATVTPPPAAITDPQITKPDQTQPPVKERQKAQHIVKNPDDPAMKRLQEMMAAFDAFADNKDKYVKGVYDYTKYKAEEKKISDRISSFINFYDVCEKSLKYDMDPKTKKFRKDHWKGKTQEQRNSFTSLFRKLIEAIVYPATIDFFGNLKIEHSVIKSTADNVEIKSVIYYKKKDLIMEWYFHKADKANWMVYDIGIEGERWVQSFRSQFNDIISKKSYKELINMMDKKLKETLEDNEKKDKQLKKA